MHRGAYGLALDSLGASELFGPAEDGWVSWTIDTAVRGRIELNRSRMADFIEPDRARLTLTPDGFVDVDRLAATTKLMLTHEPSLDELVHPGIATTGATLAWWQGRLALHGCAVTDGTSAVAFLGGRGQGKSSTLARLISQGWGSVSDDLLVIDGVDVLAGPRVADLRQETAEAWSLGTYLGVVGTRERWRFRTDEVPARSRLAGFVILEWGKTIRLDRVPPAQRLGALMRHRTLDIVPREPAAVLRVASVPTFVLTRPRDIAAIDDALGLVVESLGLGQPGGLQQT